jgi:hypothetical protein
LRKNKVVGCHNFNNQNSLTLYQRVSFDKRSLMVVVLTFNLPEKIDWGLKSFVISCCFCDFNRFFVSILKL